MNLNLKDPNRKFPSARTDQYALAVLIYQYLLRRHPLDGKRIPPAQTAEEQELLAHGKQALFCEHPTDAANRPEKPNYVPSAALGPFLSELFQRTFVKGLHAPNDRPAANEWVRGLVKTVDLLLTCANPKCPGKWLVVSPQNTAQIKCPWCGTAVRGPYPMLNLRAERRSGVWMADGHIVLFNGSVLQKWHTADNVFPGPESDKEPQAMVTFDAPSREWRLINKTLSSLTVVSNGERIALGGHIPLKQGQQIRFGQEEHARMADVQMLGA